jgi:hypothetical protein
VTSSSAPVVLQRWWGARIAIPRLHSPGARDLTRLALEHIVISHASPFKPLDWTLRWRGHVMVITPAYALELVGGMPDPLDEPTDPQMVVLGYAPELCDASHTHAAPGAGELQA